MLNEYEILQMDDEGKLGPLRDICVVAAQRTFVRRKDMDTGQLIVQMKLRGEMIPHWYYRSQEHVSQPYFIPSQFIQPYQGPANAALPWLYGPGTYEVDEELTNLTINEGFIEPNDY